jgi:quercetin dioxygenase-like cupin family protein
MEGAEMGGKFMINAEMKPNILDWGRLCWLSNPSATGAKQLTVIAGDVFPNKGHAFHRHPDQEEVLLVVAGKVEQWIEREMRVLGPGDSAFIPAGIVHGTFNTGAEDAKVVAILGPCVGDAGIEQVDMSGEPPWNTLRA